MFDLLIFRIQESPIGNWFADISRHTYDAALCHERMQRGPMAFCFCAGTFRGDSVYGPGLVTIGDILEMLPFEDPIIVLEVDGETLWEAFENALSSWPAQEGRFPAISGFRVSWDSRLEPGSRILNIWQIISKEGAQDKTSSYHEEPVKRETGGKKYILVTREYMARGYDGFTALTRGKVLINDECGHMLSTIVRKYLLGSQFINKVIRSKKQHETPFLQKDTKATISELEREVNMEHSSSSTAAKHWKKAATLASKHVRSKFHYRNHLTISETEHMTGVDAFDGAKARKGLSCAEVPVEENEDLLVIHPVVDGRLKDMAKDN